MQGQLNSINTGTSSIIVGRTTIAVSPGLFKQILKYYEVGMRVDVELHDNGSLKSIVNKSREVR